MHETERHRLRVVAGIVLFLALLLICRLYFLTAIRGEAYTEEAEKQYVQTVSNAYNRGTIYFTQKDGQLVSAATLNTGYLIAIDPSRLTNEQDVYEKLNAIVSIDKKDFLKKAKKKEDIYEEIVHRVSEADMTKIKALDIEGVQSFRERWRYYPGGTLAARVLGFVSYQGDVLSGRYGVERYYNDILARTNENLYVNFFAEIFTNINHAVFEQSTEDEGDVVLTIEPSVQAQLEAELVAVQKEWHSTETGGIIMDPKSGKIYAMGVTPTFDLNKYNEESNPSIYNNPLVEDNIEMGSIIKALTMAAGLDAGVVNARTTYTDTGRVTMNGRTFSNYDGVGRGANTSMQTVLNKSLNTGVAFVVGRLGHERFSEYMIDKFHLGDETGIDLPKEVQGLTENLASTRDIEYATASFGQGIAMTPINTITALASLGNGGTVPIPYITDEIRYKSGRVKKIVPNPPVHALKEETSEEITRMLVTVVDEALLDGKVKIPEYSIAAKTGTAQIARPRNEGGGYYENRYNHTFFGYFPAYDPKFIILLYTKYPKDVNYASHTLTKPFINLTKFLLNFYQIPPDRLPS